MSVSAKELQRMLAQPMTAAHERAVRAAAEAKRADVAATVSERAAETFTRVIEQQVAAGRRKHDGQAQPLMPRAYDPAEPSERRLRPARCG